MNAPPYQGCTRPIRPAVRGDDERIQRNAATSAGPAITVLGLMTSLRVTIPMAQARRTTTDTASLCQAQRVIEIHQAISAPAARQIGTNTVIAAEVFVANCRRVPLSTNMVSTAHAVRMRYVLTSGRERLRRRVAANTMAAHHTAESTRAVVVSGPMLA